MKKILKKILTGFTMVLVLPLVIIERVARASVDRDVLFGSHADFLSLFPGVVGYYLRNSYYYMTMKRCSLDCAFSFGTRFTHSQSVVNERVFTGYDCILGYVEVGANTMLADRVSILSGGHQHGGEVGEQTFQEQPKNFTTIHIGRNCWIGTGAIIMANVGDDSIIGAGSVVTRPIGSGEVAVGNPARSIRKNVAIRESTV
jgi:virginiamycin A acetyltransferase